MTATDNLRSEVRAILEEELQDLLKDAAWRIKQAWDHSQVPAEGLNLNQHLLTGYTVTANSPVAGSIAWDDLHIVYQGVDYGPFSGDTDMAYVWFDHDHATSKIQTSNTKPTLAKDDAIIFVNEGGQVYEPLKSQLQHGGLILDGTVRSGELADNAVIASKILNGAVGTNQLANTAVTAGKLGNGAVTEAKLGGGAVTAAKLGNGAVEESKLADNAVSSGKIANNAVSATKISDGAVETNKLADTAVTSSKLANKAVTTGKLGDNAVGTGQLDDEAVTGGKIAPGAVGSAAIQEGGINTSKLNLFQHLLY